MKRVQSLIIVLLGALAFMSCTKSTDPSVTSNLSLKMSAASVDGKTSMGGRISSADGRTSSTITLTDVKVNLRELEFEFDHDDDHFKKDPDFDEDNEAKLKGPFIIDLMNAGSFVDQVVTSVNVPNARYEKIKFKLSPSEENGDMKGKSVLITGSIGDTPFIFWHNARAKFGAKFSDNTSITTSGEAVTVAIHLELDKILSKLNGGVDLSTAQDRNNDGTITIDPMNDDGNKELADAIMNLLTRHTHCEKEKH